MRLQKRFAAMAPTPAKGLPERFGALIRMEYAKWATS
jgi:hypothetical protein